MKFSSVSISLLVSLLTVGMWMTADNLIFVESRKRDYPIQKYKKSQKQQQRRQYRIQSLQQQQQQDVVTTNHRNHNNQQSLQKSTPQQYPTATNTTTTVTTVTTTQTTIYGIHTLQDEERIEGGIYYDESTGDVLDPGNEIPDSYEYYIRMWSPSISKKSMKMKSCKGSKKKKRKDHKKKRMMMKSKKSSKKECEPMILSDPIYPDHCIYDDTNDIRYCKPLLSKPQYPSPPALPPAAAAPSDGSRIPSATDFPVIASSAPKPSAPTNSQSIPPITARPVVVVDSVSPVPGGSTNVPSALSTSSRTASPTVIIGPSSSLSQLPSDDLGTGTPSPTLLSDGTSEQPSAPSTNDGVGTDGPVAVIFGTRSPTAFAIQSPTLPPGSLPPGTTVVPIVPGVSETPTTVPGTLPPGTSASPSGTPRSGSDVPSALPGTDGSPTAPPVANIVEVSSSSNPSNVSDLFDMSSTATEANTNMTYRKIIHSDSVLLVVSTFDPWIKSVSMFEIIKAGLLPYCVATVGDIANEVNISMSYIEELTSYERISRSAGDGSLATFYSSINVTFDLVSFDPEIIDNFTDEQAALVIRRYFEGDLRNRLEERLAEGGLPVEELSLFSSTPEKNKDDLEPQPNVRNISNTTDGPTDSDSNKDGKQGGQTYAGTSNDSSTSDGTNSGMKASMIGGAVAFATIGILFFAVMRRKRNTHWATKELSSSNDKSKHQDLSGDSDYDSDAEQSKEMSYMTNSSPKRNVSPHSLPEQYQLQTSDRESNSTSIKSASRLFASRFTSVQSVRTFKKANVDSKRKTQVPAGVDEVDLIRFEDGPDLIAATDCLSGDDEDPAEIKHADFDMYQRSKPSLSNISGWPSLDDVSVSTPSYSIAPSSNFDDDDYKEARRKWQESSHDLDSIPTLNQLELDQMKTNAEGSVASSDTEFFGFSTATNDPLTDLLEEISLHDKAKDEEEKVEEADESEAIPPVSNHLVPFVGDVYCVP